MYPQAGSSLGGKNACPDGSSDAQVPMTLTCPDMVRYAHRRAYSTTSAAMCCIGGDSNENKVSYLSSATLTTAKSFSFPAKESSWVPLDSAHSFVCSICSPSSTQVLSLLLQNGWQVVDSMQCDKHRPAFSMIWASVCEDQKNKVGERADVVAKRLDPKGQARAERRKKSPCRATL